MEKPADQTEHGSSSVDEEKVAIISSIDELGNDSKLSLESGLKAAEDFMQYGGQDNIACGETLKAILPQIFILRENFSIQGSNYMESFNGVCHAFGMILRALMRDGESAGIPSVDIVKNIMGALSFRLGVDVIDVHDIKKDTDGSLH